MEETFTYFVYFKYQSEKKVLDGTEKNNSTISVGEDNTIFDFPIEIKTLTDLRTAERILVDHIQADYLMIKNLTKL